MLARLAETVPFVILGVMAGIIWMIAIPETGPAALVALNSARLVEMDAKISLIADSLEALADGQLDCRQPEQ